MLGEMRQRVLHLPQEERKDEVEEGTSQSLTTLCSFSFGRLAERTLYRSVLNLILFIPECGNRNTGRAARRARHTRTRPDGDGRRDSPESRASWSREPPEPEGEAEPWRVGTRELATRESHGTHATPESSTPRYRRRARGDTNDRTKPLCRWRGRRGGPRDRRCRVPSHAPLHS